MKKRKRFITLLAMMLTVCMALGTAASFAAVATEDVASIEENGGPGKGAYTESLEKGGPNGRYAPWNKAQGAIECPEDYANRLISEDPESSPDGFYSYQLTSDITFGTATMEASTAWIFNVTEQAEGEVAKIKYTGYKIYHPRHPAADGT